MNRFFQSLLGLLAMASPAWATSFYERPFPDSVKDAPVIARGRVGASYTDWARTEDSNKRIYTYWELQVEEVLKGGAGGGAGTLRMRELGGEKDGVGMQISGAAQFNAGEQVVVFLGERNAEGSHDVWGMMMGKYNLQKDESGTEVLVGPGINDLTAPRLGDGPEGHGGHGDTPAGAKKWTLAAVRHLIASQGGAPAPIVNPSPGRTVTPRPKPMLPSAPPPSTTAGPSAPPLQNSSSEDSEFPWGPGLALGTGILGLLLILIAKRRA